MKRALSHEELLAIFKRLTAENQARALAFLDALNHGYTGTVQEWLEMEKKGAAIASTKE